MERAARSFLTEFGALGVGNGYAASAASTASGASRAAKSPWR